MSEVLKNANGIKIKKKPNAGLKYLKIGTTATVIAKKYNKINEIIIKYLCKNFEFFKVFTIPIKIPDK